MIADEKKKIITVIGPGRSGTSAIARGLMVFGVDLGDNLMPPKYGVNDKGFWEDQDLYELNNDIFKWLNHDWHRLPPVDLTVLSEDKYNQLKSRAVELVRKKTKSTNLFGVKDPQLTRLLPFWREVFSYLSFIEGYVIACRNPSSVARSLSKYTGFSIKKSYLLWFEHTLASLIGSAGANRLVVSYDSLMQDPLLQLQRIGSALDLRFDAHGSDYLEYCSDFLDIGLRHNEYQIDDLSLDANIPPKCIELYKLMLKFATDSLEIDSQGAIEEIRKLQALHQEDLFLLNFVQDLDDKQTKIHAQLAERDKAVSTLGQTVESLLVDRDAHKAAAGELQQRIGDLARMQQEQLEGLNRVIAERDKAVSTLGQTVESLLVDRDAHKAAAGELQQRIGNLARVQQEQLEGLSRVIAERDKAVSTLGQTVESLLVDRDAHKAAAGELQQRIGDLARMQQEQLEGLNRVIAMKESSLNTIYASKSWRITAPLRQIVRLLSNLQSSRLRIATNVGNSESHKVTSSQVPSGPVTDIPMSNAKGNAEGEKTYQILLVSYYYPTRSHAGGLRILDIYTLIKQRCPEVRLDLLTYHRPSIDGSITDSHRIFDNIYLSPVEDLSPSCLEGLTDIWYDLIDLQFHQAAYHLEGYRRIASKIIFTPMESSAKVLYLEMRNQIKTSHRIELRGLLALFKIAYEEISFCRNSDYVVCVSKTDAAFIRAVGGGRKVHAIETGISPLEFPDAWIKDFTKNPASVRSKQIIYVAYFGSQTNVNALRWYLQEVHPSIAKAVPDYKLVVVGRGDLSSFEAYRGLQVELVGEVPTLAPYIKLAKLGIAPALSGSGFRGKVNQYAVLGIPAVVSSIALQGLDYRDGESVFIADDPQEFADRCIRLLVDDELNDRMAQSARKLCMMKYSWESKWPKICAAYGLKEHVSC